MPPSIIITEKHAVPAASSLTAAPNRIFGLDIGGTKCALSVLRDGRVEEIVRVETGDFTTTFNLLTDALGAYVADTSPIFGISCGGPLDASAGIVLSPPNLHASWHGVAITRLLTQRFGGRAFLMNDANACALAEWQFGAGRGAKHMIFLTSGTGMGGGLILNGELYEGATGDAGEIGHVRLRADGPVGFNKAGSVEGFYSGGGIARLAESLIQSRRDAAPSWYSPEVPVTTKLIADAAKSGEVLALEIMHQAGESLGEALAILIDLFNPERVVIGGFFPSCRILLEPSMHAVLRREALTIPREACTVVPALLGDTIGSHGAIAVGLRALTPAPLQP